MTTATDLTGHAKARHMARYSHRPWIAWAADDGTICAAQATPENLERAIADIGRDGKLSGYFGDRFGQRASYELAQVWLANARIGWLTC